MNRHIQLPLKLSLVAVSYALALSSAQAQQRDAELQQDAAATTADREKAETDIEIIMVKGIRKAQEAAVDVKRAASNIVDSIVAEDIGKLPDATIADSLQRITGVQIDRTAGEGSSLNVRGMPQVLTTLNGEQFLSPWSITNVQANYSDIPSAMISSVDVHKSIPASMIAGGISGVVDLKTRKPLEIAQGWTLSAGLEGSKGSITDKTNHDANAFAGFNNGDFAFTLAAFHSNSNSANYQMYEDSRMAWPNAGGDPLDLNGNGNTTNDRFLVPAGYGVKAYVMERERSGLAGAFQKVLTDSWTASAEIFYTKMEQYDRGIETQFNGSNNSNYDVLRPGSQFQEEATVPGTGGAPDRVLHSLQVAVIEAPDFQATTRSRQNHTDAINTNFQLNFDNGGPFTGSIRYVYATAEKVYEDATFMQGTPAWYWIDADNDGQNDPRDPFYVTVDYRAKYPTFTYSDDLSGVDRLNLYQAYAYGIKDEASMNALRADGKYEYELADFNSFEFGVRVGTRDVDTTRYDYLTPTGRYSTWQDPSVDPDNWYQMLPGDKVWQRYPDWRDFKGDANLGLPAATDLQNQLISYTDFGPFKGFESGVAGLDPKSLDNLAEFMDFVYPGAQKFADPAKAYNVKERATSVYLQGNFDNAQGLFGIPYSGNLGMHVVRTDRTVVQSQVPLFYEEGNYYGGGADGSQSWNAIFKSTGTKVTKIDFTDYLPSANINFFPHDDVIVRFSYAKTMSRNDLINVGEGLTLWYQEYTVTDDDGTERIVTSAGGGNDQGNPYVKPWRATNYNSSVEWYFAEGGILGAGIFLIDVKSATETLQEQRQYADSDGVVRRSVNVWTTKNVGASDLKGFELGYKQSYSFLPYPFNGLGSELNYTYSDSESTDKDLEGKPFPLPSNSKHQYNAVLWYQAGPFSTRVAYNWRSEQFNGRVGLNTNEAPISLGNWAKAAGYLDAAINYDPTPNLTLYLQGTNLTETNQRSYAQFKSQFHSMSVQERRITLGVRMRL